MTKKQATSRKSSAPLQVMLEPAQKARYEKFAEDLGIPMRELVINAIEQAMAEAHQAKLPAENVLAGDHDAYVLMRDLHQPLVGDDGRPLPKSIDLALLAKAVTGLLRRVTSLERQRR